MRVCLTKRHLLANRAKRPNTAPAEPQKALHPVYLTITSTSPHSSPQEMPQLNTQRGPRSVRWDLEEPLTLVQVCFRHYVAYAFKQRYVRQVSCLYLSFFSIFCVLQVGSRDEVCMLSLLFSPSSVSAVLMQTVLHTSFHMTICPPLIPHSRALPGRPLVV